MTAVTANGLIAPPHDRVVNTYVADGAADNDDVETKTFYRGDKIVGVWTYTYAGSTNNITSIILSAYLP